MIITVFDWINKALVSTDSYFINKIIFLSESSGFVYGSMSFVEKMSFGAVFMLIQKFMPVFSHDTQISIPYFKLILSYGCGGTYLWGLICAGFLMTRQIRERYVILYFDYFVECPPLSIFFRFNMDRANQVEPNNS